MPKYQYQFQYDPTDRKAIREATGVVSYSPATTLNIWAIGFAICLLVLGASGAWTELVVLLVAATFFVAYYVNRLGRKSFADREYRVRTLTITDDSVLEEFGSSMFEKSWGAFEEFIETNEHLLLRHYEKITALPKRSIPRVEIEECKDFIDQKLAIANRDELRRFKEWFSSDGREFPAYSFRWQQDDIQKLSLARLQPFGKDPAEQTATNSSVMTRLVLTVVLLAIAGTTMFVLNQFVFGVSNRLASQLLYFVFAISIPFVFALIWWQYTARKTKNRKPRIPEEEIFVTVNEQELLIGYSRAVAAYNWCDISALFTGEDFIGFRPKGGIVHVIAVHAFGSFEKASEFLELADTLMRDRKRQEQGSNKPGFEAVETGNPFQAPGF